MAQQTHTPDAEFDRLLNREFGLRSADALQVLRAYTRDEQARVWLALLKLASGSLEELQSLTTLAIADYRDVIAMAEYPLSIGIMPEDPQEIWAAARRADSAQYQAWLDGDCIAPD